MKDTLNHLLNAVGVGRNFRSALQQTDDLPRTKWIDTLGRSAKPAVLAVMVAAGATGCSTLSGHHLVDDRGADESQYASFVDEASTLSKMPRSDLAQIIKDRPQADQYEHLQRTTVGELAAQLNKASGDTREVLSDPLVIDNPFQPGKLVHVSRNSDMGASWDIGVKEYGSILYALGVGGTESAHAINANHIYQADDEPSRSLTGLSQQSYVVLGDQVAGGRGSAPTALNKDKDVQEYAFTLFHELAHTTFAEELALYGGANSDSDTAGHAHNTTYRPTNEIHADLSALMASNKMFDWSPEEMRASIEDLSDHSTMLTLNAGVSDRLSASSSTSDYAMAYSGRVLLELLEREPEMLKDLSYEAIPLVAYDIVKKAGYFYNAADYIDREVLTRVSSDMGSSSAMRNDMRAISSISMNLPASTKAYESAQALKDVWYKAQSNTKLEHLRGTLDAFVDFDGPEANPKTLRSFESAIQYVDGHPDSHATLRAIGERLQVISQNGLTQGHARAISQTIDRALDMVPGRNQLAQDRSELISEIHGDLQNHLDRAAYGDPSFQVAEGSGQTIEDIAIDIQEIYGAPDWLAIPQDDDYSDAPSM